MAALVDRLADTFRGRRVLVTGDTGFKGAWLSLWLHMMGAKVFGFARPELSDQDLFARAGLRNLIDHTDGDICDAQAVEAVFAEAKPEVVLHLAAQSLVRASYHDPVETYQTNLMGSVQILEAVRRHSDSIRSFIYVTSDKCYWNNEWVYGYRETDTLGGKDPYSASKAAAEVIFTSYRHSFFDDIPTLGFASVRAGNVIGGGDFAQDRIVPDCIRALSAERAIDIRNPHATRPWQHVLDPLSGYLTLAEDFLEDPISHRGPWNFGPDNSANKPVGALVQDVVHHWGQGSFDHTPDDSNMHEAGLLLLNCDKAHAALGWRPRWAYPETIEHTVGWYRRVHGGEDPLRVTQDQIETYVNGG